MSRRTAPRSAEVHTRSLAELAIDAEEDRLARAVLVGMLREAERPGPS
jgi:hypothetical protein